MRAIRTYFIILFFVLSGDQVFSQTDTSGRQQIALNNFVVRENLLKNNKLAIIATDPEEKPIENLSGTFQFSINGFQQELKFNDGVAVAAQPIDKSTFLYIRHENESGTNGKLYYVIKKDNNLNPVKISWLILVLVPLGIIILATMFRKFIIIACVLLLLLFYFNSSQGLKLPTFFDTVVDGLRNLV